MQYLLFNSRADGGKGEENAKAAKEKLGGDITLVKSDETDLFEFAKGLKKDDKAIVLGGDGTLNYLINHIDVDHLPCPFFLYPSGTGNDFARDVNEGEEELIPLDKFLSGLPYVKVKDKVYRFINGIGYGIDGECCRVADEKTAKGEEVDYTKITISLLLGSFKPRNATVKVDGKEYTFKKAYLASAMKGRFYGGGMMIAPEQKRDSGLLSFVVIHGKGKLGTLMLFPKIFKGEHVKAKKHVSVIEGKHIEVSYDGPCALQIDGETVKDVMNYGADVNPIE